jgi:hypothetical protein
VPGVRDVSNGLRTTVAAGPDAFETIVADLPDTPAGSPSELRFVLLFTVAWIAVAVAIATAGWTGVLVSCVAAALIAYRLQARRGAGRPDTGG